MQIPEDQQGPAVSDPVKSTSDWAQKLVAARLGQDVLTELLLYILKHKLENINLSYDFTVIDAHIELIKATTGARRCQEKRRYL